MPAVPLTQELFRRLLSGVQLAPLTLQLGDVLLHLERSLRHQLGVLGQLDDLASRGVEREPRGAQRGAQLRVRANDSLRDAAECSLLLQGGGGVQRAPLPICEHARVPLHVNVAVRVAGSRGAVHDRNLFEPLDGYELLLATRTYPRDVVLPQVRTHRGRRVGLRGVQRCGDLRHQSGGHR